MPPDISGKIYCTAELRFVNCELSTEKKFNNNNNLATVIGWSLLLIVTVLKERGEQLTLSILS